MANTTGIEGKIFGSETLKKDFASMVKEGVIMDVTNAEQAKIAEKSGAVAVMALERVPADIRSEGGVARMANIKKVAEILKTVTIPVMAKCRIGHYSEAKILENLGIYMIDESEVLTMADPYFHVDKKKFAIPFVCGAREFGEAVRRIFEGAAMIRTKGEAGTGDVIEAVRHMHMINEGIAQLKKFDDGILMKIATNYTNKYCKLIQEDYEKFGINRAIEDDDVVFSDYTYGNIKREILKILNEIKELQRLPVVNFAAGGIATPADAALMMTMGCDGVFVGSGIFKSDDPEKRAKAIVEATSHFNEPEILKEVAKNLGEGMKGIEASKVTQALQERGI
ncbi:MAG: pyridoxal 5'-phosphate synthase lyase subunit PdxS [Candidatus Altiarchaeum hamiconexum]|uniref:Pyridoxal 5'-phosphate synthase subunit PdxS n=1 Tax=Candidatus Altarchaeum hamiconexum TaxID=1803513 RepID=A0A8J7Z1V5_9ARCH|nr:pyridoxal 5'-phosphate synthase lyase subunit PdxS [Candidatus Altarchaeum hamiconexum]OIQ05445.1 MAG: pyridoxal biosynthesis lyase PdxS [Candidatus Altarchaeum sp. CG2_30_32_3053]PIN68047.1 MAG: pyridoxal 5'-phosphate synthase lyase subunit PdxS [Candidatus Altarchaeum sp. CG12_big_fil_rev_8_21_14_0_65_33_22]PIV28702.1 MAG: pyridoxal 5'-phosphate synthase lyase subunit PdxS [Candidatus Altarchaeum sp. CG03_land_8_20_14_0_80_32_618]PIX49239.1 MAG: pyridoxal 5'-phosphate synthase lyase subuni